MMIHIWKFMEYNFCFDPAKLIFMFLILLSKRKSSFLCQIYHFQFLPFKAFECLEPLSQFEVVALHVCEGPATIGHHRPLQFRGISIESRHRLR